MDIIHGRRQMKIDRGETTNKRYGADNESREAMAFVEHQQPWSWPFWSQQNVFGSRYPSAWRIQHLANQSAQHIRGDGFHDVFPNAKMLRHDFVNQFTVAAAEDNRQVGTQF